jgi:hypothetical protein
MPGEQRELLVTLILLSELLCDHRAYKTALHAEVDILLHLAELYVPDSQLTRSVNAIVTFHNHKNNNVTALETAAI